MAVTVAARIWREWDVRSQEDEPAIVLFFRPKRLDVDSAIDMIVKARHRALSEIEQILRERGELDDDPWGGELTPGAVLLSAAPGGVVVRVDEEPWDLRELLGRMATALEELGVAGRFDLYDAEMPDYPRQMALLVLHMRLEGTAIRSPRLHWQVDADALEQEMTTAVAWLRRTCGDDQPLRLDAGVVSSMLPPHTDVLPYVRRGIDQSAPHWNVRVVAIEAERVAGIAFSHEGRVTYMVADDQLDRRWRDVLTDLRAQLIAAAGHIVYGLLKPGLVPLSTLLWGAVSPHYDWVAVPHDGEGLTIDMHRAGYDHQYVPDIFGVQLLGPGHRNRLHDAPGWTTTDLGAGRTLLEHERQATWYDGSFPVFTFFDVVHGGIEPRVPGVLEQARAEFAELLLTSEVRRRLSS
jgi:hypothetical protein